MCTLFVFISVDLGKVCLHIEFNNLNAILLFPTLRIPRPKYVLRGTKLDALWRGVNVQSCNLTILVPFKIQHVGKGAIKGDRYTAQY